MLGDKLIDGMFTESDYEQYLRDHEHRLLGTIWAYVTIVHHFRQWVELRHGQSGEM